MWVGYGLGEVTADPDKGFRVRAGVRRVRVGASRYRVSRRAVSHETRRGGTTSDRVARRRGLCIQSPGRGDPIPLAVRHHNLLFFGGDSIPGFQLSGPGDRYRDTVRRRLAQRLLRRSRASTGPGIDRLEDVSMPHPPAEPDRCCRCPFQSRYPVRHRSHRPSRQTTASFQSLASHPAFVKRCGTRRTTEGPSPFRLPALTFGQGGDFEFWDPAPQPSLGRDHGTHTRSRWRTGSVNCKHGLEPRL